MKTTTTAAIAAMMIGTAALMAQDLPAVEPIIENQRTPANRITLANNQTRVVTSVTIPVSGAWNVSGGATVQVNVDPGTYGQYIYTQAAFSTDPHVLTLDGTVGLDSRPYGTYWFNASPHTHSFQAQAGTTIYLIVKYYGQTPAALVQAFGSINAMRN